MSPDDFKRLVVAGLSTDQIAIVMEMMDRDARAVAEADEARKAKGRERVAKWRLERRNVTVTQPNVTVPLTGGGDARVEDKSLTSEIEPQEEKKTTPASPSPRQQLEAVLDPEQADAIIEHRKRIKAPLTSRAAKLLAGELAKCPDPRAAADLILLKGWRGFEAKWVLGDQSPRAGPQTPRINPTLEAALRLQGEIDAVSPSEIEGNHPPPRLVAIGGRTG